GEGIPDAGAALAPQGNYPDQGNVPQSPLWRHGRARAEDYRRLHLQAAQEARQRLRRPQLHRDRVGPRLRAARAARGRRADPGLITGLPESPSGSLLPDWTPPQMAGVLFLGD